MKKSLLVLFFMLSPAIFSQAYGMKKAMSVDDIVKSRLKEKASSDDKAEDDRFSNKMLSSHKEKKDRRLSFVALKDMSPFDSKRSSPDREKKEHRTSFNLLKKKKDSQHDDQASKAKPTLSLPTQSQPPAITVTVHATNKRTPSLEGALQADSSNPIENTDYLESKQALNESALFIRPQNELADLVNARPFNDSYYLKKEFKTKGLLGDDQRTFSILGCNGELLVAHEASLSYFKLGEELPLHIFEGHTHHIKALAVSPDGSMIISGAKDCLVKIWDVQTQACLFTLRGHRHDVSAVAISPDGQTIVSGSLDNAVIIWDAKTGECIQRCVEHTNWISDVALSADGSRAVSISADKTTKVWDTATGESLCTIQGHALTVAISPDGQTIITGSIDNALTFWEAATGRCLVKKHHSSSVSSVAISPDGRRVISGSLDKTIRVWDLQTGACLQILLPNHEYHLSSLVISSDGKNIYSIDWNRTVRLWQLFNETLLVNLDQNALIIKLSEDRSQLVKYLPEREKLLYATLPESLRDIIVATRLVTMTERGALKRSSPNYLLNSQLGKMTGHE